VAGAGAPQVGWKPAMRRPEWGEGQGNPRGGCPSRFRGEERRRRRF